MKCSGTIGKRAENLLLLGFNEVTDHLARSNRHWYGRVLCREDSHVLRMALEFDVKGHRWSQRLKWTVKVQVAEENMKVALSREDALC